MEMNQKLSVDDILAMPATERLRIVEAIWDSIAAEPETVPVTEAQKREIADRLAEYRRDPSIAIPWNVARAQIRDAR